MYESFFGFNEKPFSLLPDPAFLFLGKNHGDTLSMLEYGLTSQAGFTVITGEIGCGKTTLVRHVLGHLAPDITVGLITNTHRSFRELLRWVLLAFDLDCDAEDPVARYEKFTDFVIGEYAKGRRTVLLIDEAQNMGVATLEELRLLSNLNVDKHLALQLVLVGQPELRATLRDPRLRQFSQRIAVDYHLEPLSLEETLGYVRHRLQVAGGDPDTFTPGSHGLVHRHTGGIPRLINVLCDTALVYAYGERSTRVGPDLIAEVARDKARGGLFGPPSVPAAAKLAESTSGKPPGAGLSGENRDLARELFGIAGKKSR
jgi:type II secretory pathway predicted ATPase ExeA